jgi:hypothetical protein
VNHCKTCKHWRLGAFDPPRNLDDPDPPERVCFKIIHLHSVSLETGQKLSGKPMPETGAYLTDADGYAASLYTAPDFGCVLWQMAQG